MDYRKKDGIGGAVPAGNERNIPHAFIVVGSGYSHNELDCCVMDEKKDIYSRKNSRVVNEWELVI